MRLRLSGRGVKLSAELKNYVTRRLHFSLGRFAGRIRSLSIHLSDINGPRGGIDKVCDIRVDVGFRKPVIVRERQANIHTAVAFAVDRAERVVQRHLRLASTGGRGGAPPSIEFRD